LNSVHQKAEFGLKRPITGGSCYILSKTEKEISADVAQKWQFGGSELTGDQMALTEEQADPLTNLLSFVSIIHS